MKYLKTIFSTFIISFLCLGFPATVSAGTFKTGLNDAYSWATGGGVGLSALTLNVIIQNVIAFLVNLVGFLSVLGIVIGGILYIISPGDEKKASQAKRVITFSLLGLIIVGARLLFTEAVVTWLGLPITDPYFQPPAGLSFTNIIIRTTAFLGNLIALLSTLFIIVGGFRYITSAGDDQKTAKAKQTIFAALAGLLIALIAGRLIDVIVGITLQAGANPLPIGNVIFNIIAFILAFTAIIAVAAFVYGGFTYLTSGGGDEKIQRGKRTIIYAVVGIIVIMISAVIVNIVI